MASYTICFGGVIGFLSIKFNSIINLEVNFCFAFKLKVSTPKYIQVAFYANVLALCIAVITIGALLWSICGSKSHAAYKPANGHTRTRVRKSSLFMIIFLSCITSFAISVISLFYSFNL